MSPQHRYASRPGGSPVWVRVSDEDRRRVIQSLPVRSRKWVDAIVLQEGGEYDGPQGLRKLWDRLHFRCSFADFREGMSVCRVWIETELENLALSRAGGPNIKQPPIDQDIVDYMERVERGDI